MAGVSAGPDAFFSVKPAELAKPECFAVRWGELEERINAEYYKVEVRQLLDSIRSQFPNIKPISAYGEIICGPFGSSIKLGDYVEDGVPLLRISNISSEGNLDFHDLVFITPELSEKLSSTQVSEGDIIVSQRGTLGITAVVSSEFPIFNISANLIAIKGLYDLVSRYVQLYLSSTLGEAQLSRLQSGQVHPKITTDDVASVLVPNIPNQVELVADMDAARVERKAKLAQADELLASIDDFVLDALDIMPPQKETRRVFAVRPSHIIGQQRLNSEYHHPERTKVLSALQATSEILTSRRLMEVAHFEREQLKTPCENYLGLAHVQSNTGELTDATNTASGNCSVFRTDDVLFARLRPYLNKVYRAEMNGCCSTEFHVLRVKDSETLLPEYLAAILRSRIVLAQTTHMMTGNTHPRLTNYDVETLTIPIPSLEVQRVIADEVNRRREEARRLRAEAEAGWNAAKARFEARLLGGAL